MKALGSTLMYGEIPFCFFVVCLLLFFSKWESIAVAAQSKLTLLFGRYVT